jgi:hypothetical protein
VCTPGLSVPTLSKATVTNPLMGNFCCRASTVPSPQERTTPTLVPSRPSTERSPVSSSSQPSRMRTRAASKPESTHHSRISSQDSSYSTPRSRKKSAPQPLQSSKSSSPQKTRTRAETLSTPKKSGHSDSGPTKPGESDG